MRTARAAIAGKSLARPGHCSDIGGAFLTLSSRGLGHRPFTAVTRVRIPLGSPARSVIAKRPMAGYAPSNREAGFASRPRRFHSAAPLSSRVLRSASCESRGTGEACRCGCFPTPAAPHLRWRSIASTALAVPVGPLLPVSCPLRICAVGHVAGRSSLSSTSSVIGSSRMNGWGKFHRQLGAV